MMNSGWLAKGLLGLALSVAFVCLSSSEARAQSTWYCGAHGGATCEAMYRGETLCYSNPCYGRCGPSCNWSVLGYVVTSACQIHDACIETQMCSYGQGSFSAQVNCLPQLVPAIGSMINNAWYDAVSWVEDTATSVWKKIKSWF